MQYLASDISLEGFSKVAGSTGDITDSDNLLVALAKLQNRTASATPTSTFARVPAQKGRLIYDGTLQEPEWSGYDANHVRRLSGSDLKATNAGTYTVVFSLLDGVAWEDDGTFGDRIIQWTIEKAKIDSVPSQTDTLTYTGKDLSPTWQNFNTDELEIVGLTSATNADTYTVEFTPKENYTWADGSTDSKVVEWTIEKAKIDKIPSPKNTLPYDGTTKIPEWNDYDEKQLDIDGIVSAEAEGVYTVTFTPTQNYMWADGSTISKEVSWVIEKTVVDIFVVPTLSSRLTYTGQTQAPTWLYLDEETIAISGTTSAKEIGTYATVFTPKKDGIWSDGETGTKTISWKIEKSTLNVPAISETYFEYDGTSHTLNIASYNTALISATGDKTQTNEGNYAITFSLKDTDHYQWPDNSIGDKKIEWSIGFEKFYSSIHVLRSNTMRFGTDIFMLSAS